MCQHLPSAVSPLGSSCVALFTHNVVPSSRVRFIDHMPARHFHGNRPHGQKGIYLIEMSSGPSRISTFVNDELRSVIKEILSSVQ